MKLRAEVRNRHLKFEMPEKLPAVAVDRVSIYEVMSNLIDNAVKYSHDGGDIIIKTVDKGDGLVETSVQDFGIGIPSSVLNHLFDKFYRSHRSRENIGGTGLGLYLSKQIIDAHNGSIWVKSVENEGTTFGFTVPTFDSVADQIKDAEGGKMIRSAHGWINNHGSIRR
jgi:signal transduction histidine kinase